MKLSKILLLTSIIGVLTLLLLAQNITKIKNGKITSIKYSENKISIQLKDFKERLILFETKPLNLEKGDEIFFKGKFDSYQNQEQIVIDKVWKIK